MESSSRSLTRFLQNIRWGRWVKVWFSKFSCRGICMTSLSINTFSNAHNIIPAVVIFWMERSRVIVNKSMLLSPYIYMSSRICCFVANLSLQRYCAFRVNASARHYIDWLIGRLMDWFVFIIPAKLSSIWRHLHESLNDV